VITTDITPQQVTHTASGETTLAQVTLAMQGWYDHAEFDPDKPVLWDARKAEMTLPDVEIEAWSETNRAIINEFRAGRKTAWVFGSAEAAEFVVNVLAASDFQHRVRIFNNDMEAATAWLTSTIK
jgi:hypothetical protein